VIRLYLNRGMDFTLRLIADKREIRDFPKLPSATSFIRQPLGEMAIINNTSRILGDYYAQR